MVHCGYEATAVNDTVANPLKALKVFLKGPKTDGPMAPEPSFANQRPAEYVFESHVQTALSDLHEEAEARKKTNAA
jgi:hypothetical protein